MKDDDVTVEDNKITFHVKDNKITIQVKDNTMTAEGIEIVKPKKKANAIWMTAKCALSYIFWPIAVVFGLVALSYVLDNIFI